MIIYSTPGKNEPLTQENINNLFLMDVSTILSNFYDIFKKEMYKPFPLNYKPTVSAGFKAIDPRYKSITSYNEEKKSFNKNSCEHIKLKTDKEILENIDTYTNSYHIFFVMEKNFFGGAILNIINTKDKIIEIYKIKNIKKLYSYLYCYFFTGDLYERGLTRPQIRNNLKNKKIINYYLKVTKEEFKKNNIFSELETKKEIQEKAMNLIKRINTNSNKLIKKIINYYNLEIVGAKTNIVMFN